MSLIGDECYIGDNSVLSKFAAEQHTNDRRRGGDDDNASSAAHSNDFRCFSTTPLDDELRRHGYGENELPLRVPVASINDMTLVLDMDGTLIVARSASLRVRDELARRGDKNPLKRYTVVARPHLEHFLFYAFSSFRHVIIWTAALPVWYNYVRSTLLDPMLERISAKIGRRCTFDAVLTRFHCEFRQDTFLSSVHCSPPLSPPPPPPPPSHSSHGTVSPSSVLSSQETLCSSEALSSENYSMLDESMTIVKPLQRLWESDNGPFLSMKKENTIVVDDTPETYVDNVGNAIKVPSFDSIDYCPNTRLPYDEKKCNDRTLLDLIVYMSRVQRYYARNGTVTTMDKRYWQFKVGGGNDALDRWNYDSATRPFDEWSTTTTATERTLRAHEEPAVAFSNILNLALEQENPRINVSIMNRQPEIVACANTAFASSDYFHSYPGFPSMISSPSSSALVVGNEHDNNIVEKAIDVLQSMRTCDFFAHNFAS